ncbi:DNA-binding protein [Streptococcus pneumoniae]|nr:DNA-binding protein [Streptococcus pneumoniae]
MPDIANGRERVIAFLKEKGIKKATLAVAYGFKRQEVTNILSGTTKGPRANSFILSRKMRPRRYPYSGKKESTFVKADPELVEKLLRNTSFLECLQKKPINFQIDLEEFKRLSYEAIHDTSQVTQQ